MEQGNVGCGRGNGPGSFATRFPKGRSGNPFGRRGKPPPAGPCPYDDLTLMQRVFSQPKSADRWPSEKSLRMWFEKKPVQFIKFMLRLERKAQAARETAFATQRR